MWLRQNTSESILTPTLFDDGDFKSPEAVAFNAAGIEIEVIRRDGSVVTVTPAENAGDWYWAHVAHGTHMFTLKSTDVSTLGQLQVRGSATGVLPWWANFYVVAANVYDSLVRTTQTLTLLATNAAQLGGAAPNNLAAGDQMDLVDEPNGTAIVAIQSGLAIPGDQMDLVAAPNATALQAAADALLARTGWTAAGTLSVGSALKALYAMAHGLIAKNANVWTIYDDDGASPLYTLTISPTARTPG